MDKYMRVGMYSQSTVYVLLCKYLASILYISLRLINILVHWLEYSDIVSKDWARARVCRARRRYSNDDKTYCAMFSCC